MAEPYSHPVSARAYDALYARLHDYPGTSKKVLDLIRRETGGRDTKTMTLLDVGCGTGRHLELLAGEFEAAVGFDRSDVQVAAASERLRGAAQLHCGDMLAVREVVGEGVTFDVVVCLFSGIGYLSDAEQLATAVGEMSAVLRPGGVLLIEPAPPGISPIVTSLVDDPMFSVARMAVPRREGDVIVLDLHFLVAHDGTVDHYVENHRMRMHSDDEFTAAYRRAGLSARFDEAGLDGRGRGLWIARRPPGPA